MEPSTSLVLNEESETFLNQIDSMESPPSPPNEESETFLNQTDSMELPPSPNEESGTFLNQTDSMESPTPVLNEESETFHADSMELSVPNEESETFPNQAYTDSMELPTPAPNQVPDCSPLQVDKELLPTGTSSSVRQSSRIAERIRHMAEQRWGNGHLRDKSLGSDCCGDGHRSEDEENVNDLETEGEKDMDDDEDMDEDNDGFDITGISAWDLLGDGFEREATSIGMSLAHESSILLTIV